MFFPPHLGVQLRLVRDLVHPKLLEGLHAQLLHRLLVVDALHNFGKKLRNPVKILLGMATEHDVPQDADDTFADGDGGVLN